MIYALATVIAGLFIASSYMPPKPWPDKTIYYAFDDKLPEHFRFEANLAMSYWRAAMPDLKFLPKVEGKAFVLIQPSDDPTSCWVDGAGYYDTFQNREMVLGPNCDTGAIIHEFGHLLGLQHEHQRPDRDSYVVVHWLCIPITNWSQYVTLPWTAYLDGPYDTASVMHYEPSNALDKCPSLEMRPGVEFHQSFAPSPQDIAKLRHIYPR